LRSATAPIHWSNWLHLVDASRFSAIANEIRRAGSWQVPTMLVWENLNTQAETGEQMAARPEMKYVARQQLQAYVNNKNNNLNALRNNNVSPDASARYLGLRRQALKALADANAPLLMGTDSPQLFMVPGFAMHREMAIVAAAGVSPQRIYESGAKNVATYASTVLKQDGTFGTVVAGNTGRRQPPAPRGSDGKGALGVGGGDRKGPGRPRREVRTVAASARRGNKGRAVFLL
jgi:hypothetical protein